MEHTGREGSRRVRGRHVVLVVGRDSRRRRALARALLARDHAVLVCADPWEPGGSDPSCPLIREGRCVLLDAVDLAIVLPEGAPSPRSQAELRLCAQGAPRTLVPPDSGLDRALTGLHVSGGSGVAALVEAADGILAAP